jgi:hypothetical protein
LIRWCHGDDGGTIRPAHRVLLRYNQPPSSYREPRQIPSALGTR